MEIFASAMGQYDNVGDTVLRRPFLATLREIGQLSVFVGGRGDDYLSGLGLTAQDSIYRDSGTWRAALRRSVLREGVIYAFNAGEIEVTKPYAAHYARLMPLLIANRVRGGAALHVGLGVRSPTPWRYVVSASVRLCDLVSWRDPASRRWMRVGLQAPDWAFLEGATNQVLRDRVLTHSERKVLAVAPRYNGHQVSPEWCERLAAFAASNGLEVVAAAQIARDNAPCSQIAELVGGRSILWEDTNHARHEARLRELYAGSRVVVSERLHALVIAATEGAVPIALGADESDKAIRTLEGAGFEGYGVEPSLSRAGLSRIQNLCGDAYAVAETVIAARAELATLKERMRAAA